jgi:hypothetical protein
MVVASFMVDAGFMGWYSLIAIVMPLPDSGTTEIATAFSGTRAARNSAATLSGRTGGTVDCPLAGGARSDNAAMQAAESARTARTKNRCSKQDLLPNVAARGATRAIIRTIGNRAHSAMRLTNENGACRRRFIS